MKVTQVALRPTEESDAAGRPALTPELLAASGARYSRSNDGLEAILARIDPQNLGKSVDSIFRMLDYGHQSIADMAPVALFVDGVTLWLAYYVWSLCPTAGGQESSTRYLKLSAADLPEPDELGIPVERAGAWQARMENAFAAYHEALALWERVAADDPAVTRIPAALLADPSERAKKQVARMTRNYAFDRARYFLPAAARTNVMLLQSARAWVGLCQNLLSHPLPEARRLGNLVRAELALAAPRLLKHAEAKATTQQGIRAALDTLTASAAKSDGNGDNTNERPATPFLDVFAPAGADGETFAADLAHHDNRYAWMGESLKRTSVRFGWQAVAFGEIRDLNRHRTGHKYCPFVPLGFYSALDQLPQSQNKETLARLGRDVGMAAGQHARERLAQAGDPAYVYETLLGTQFLFEHTTTADHFLYEAELRTGTGAHFRYAKHLHDALALWYERFPQTRGRVLEGSAEPE